MRMRTTFRRPMPPMAGMLAVVLSCACSSCWLQQSTEPTLTPMPTGSVTDVEGNVYPTIKRSVSKSGWPRT